MNRLLFFAAFLLAAACSPLRQAQRAVDRAPYRNDNRYVVILSMDAFRWDLASHAHTPTLDSLRRAGTCAEVYPVFPSITFPSHYAMATGLHPDHHGVVNNRFFDFEKGRVRSVFDKEEPDGADIYGGDPIWNTAERQGRVANIFMWPGSEVPVGGRQATVWTTYSKEPSYYERAQWVLDALTPAHGEEIPNLIMWYFEEPDAVMHGEGPISPGSIAAAEHIDSVLCHFFREVRKSPVYDRINFIVTADHGMAQLSPERMVNLYGILDPEKVAYAGSGSPFFIEMKEDADVDEALRALRRVPHLKAYRKGELPARFHYGTHPTRTTDLIVIPETGWVVRFDAQEASSPGREGQHGYDNRDRDMHMVFYGTGPAFRRGYEQKSFCNHNIYLVLCHLLGVEPSPNDGDWRDVRRMFVE